MACEAPPKLPKGNLKAVNATSSSGPYALEFNLEEDFDEKLKLKPEAKGVRRPISLDSLHKHWCADADTKEELTRYALQWRERYLKLEKQLKECRQ